MTVKLTRCIEFVPKRHAFKARFYNSVELKNWIDFGSVRGNFNYLFNLILQAVLTQPEKDSPSFLACCWINSSKSSSKRICFIVLLERSKSFFSFFSCIGYLTSIPRDCNSFRITLFIQPASDSSPSSFCAFSMASRKSGSNLNWNGGFPRLFSVMCIDTSITLMVMYLCVMTYYYHMKEKTIPRSGGTLSRDLTQPLYGVMIMANRYDNAHLCARQSKIYKFYDLSTAQVVQTKATTEREARKNLGKQSLIFIARIRLYPIVERSRNWGDYSHD